MPTVVDQRYNAPPGASSDCPHLLILGAFIEMPPDCVVWLTSEADAIG
jgi:hypothetical protein